MLASGADSKSNRQVLLAYKDQKPCFLDEPAWQIVTDKAGENGSWFASDNAYHSLFACHVQGPRLLQDATTSTAQGADISAISARALTLRQAGIRALDQYIQVLEEISKAPTEIHTPNERPETVYDFQGVEFGDILAPRTFCLHHSFVITINQILLKTRSSVPVHILEAECRASAIEICKCFPALDNMTVSITGIFALAYMPFFLERAAFACPSQYKHGLQVKMERLSGSRSRHRSLENVLANMQTASSP